MISPLIQEDDQERIRILKLYGIHGTSQEEDYDNIAKLASSITGTPISLVTFIDSNRQWFKAHIGTEIEENTRELAFCSHAINDVQNTTCIPDTRNDMRFKFNPMVTGPNNIHFYAGVPILSPEGYALGTICVMDTKPNRLSQLQLEALGTLRDLVSKLLKIRRYKIENQSE